MVVPTVKTFDVDRYVIVVDVTTMLTWTTRRIITTIPPTMVVVMPMVVDHHHMIGGINVDNSLIGPLHFVVVDGKIPMIL
jgi:hypothetical protein